PEPAPPPPPPFPRAAGPASWLLPEKGSQPIPQPLGCLALPGDAHDTRSKGEAVGGGMKILLDPKLESIGGANPAELQPRLAAILRGAPAARIASRAPSAGEMEAGLKPVMARSLQPVLQ